MRWRKCIFQKKRPTEERDALGNTIYQWEDEKASEVRFSPFAPIQTVVNGRTVTKVVQTFATKASFSEIAGCERIFLGESNVREIDEISDQCPRYATGTVKVYGNENNI